ncbi:Crp/Fnr family transcriptional regulator [Knoellia subterranea]|uniref:Crp/Fnr family transcriptional regulator n=1 Tax=Knoellia subterranea KCTC 19937 TaxID=1385521 RepID=A0A0A0JVE7_9MICO|nr:Crp/Fnr family transcriptional regulator [Knoellia subterranea]KGN39606.1 hypothetical protein N803_02150 [Knoellia subterranea KCTC 19937]
MEWPLLASLAPEQRTELLSRTTIRDVVRGQFVVREGEPSDSFHLIEEGHLAVRVSTADGDTATLNVLGPGDSFGELSLLRDDAPTRSASVVALERSRTRALSAADFAGFRRDHHGAEHLLLQLLGQRVEELSTRLVEVMYDDLGRRVERRLRDLVAAYATGDDGPVEIPLTQEDLAEIVGATRPSTNQALHDLAARGVVHLGRGRISVLDPSSLDGARPAGVARRPGVTR